MRHKFRILLCLIFALALSCGISFAKEDVKTEKFTIDGKNVNIPVVGLQLDGKKLSTDVPPIILNDRTLVPVRAVAESTGCEVKWDPSTYEVTIEKERKTIKLKIDSSTVYVNGQSKSLPDKVAAKIVTYNNSGRTMVPARFILEELGAGVEWNSTSRTVMLTSDCTKAQTDSPESENCIKLEDIKVENGGIRIKTSGKPDFSEYVVSEPDRLVVDLKNTKFDLSSSSIDVKSNSVTKVRASQFETSPMVSRVVFDLEQSSTYTISSGDSGLLVSFSGTSSQAQSSKDTQESGTGSSTAGTADASSGQTADSAASEPHSNPAAITTKTAYGSQAYEISTKNELKTSTIFLSSPERVAVDLFGAKVEDEQYAQKVISGSYIKEIRSYYYKDEDRTRVVFTLSSNTTTGEITALKDTNSITLIKTKFTPVVKANPIIVLDAGHGGKDPGTVGIDTKVTEKSLTLDMVQRVKPLLEQRGYVVKLTRDSDVFVDLYKRAGIANDAGADLFVSIHINATGGRSASGIETLYYPESKRENKEISVQGLSQAQVQSLINQKQAQRTRNNKSLANTMQNSLIAATGAVSRGIVERPGLVVIRETSMPAVLLELGFASNANEERLLQTEEYKTKLAYAIVNGIDTYFGR